MAFRKPIVAGNWKMNGDVELAKCLVSGFAKTLKNNSAEVLLCPPTILIESTRAVIQANETALKDCLVVLGAQNVSEHDCGAYTGEVSGKMLQKAGCRYVIIGHSERRSMYGDSSQVVADKFAAAQRCGLTPILCVGESDEARQTGKTFDVIAEQLNVVAQRNGGESFDNAVIAYEPVWAIGTGNSATPEQAQEVHAFIRKCISDISSSTGEKIRILYGGSVNPDNAEQLFAQPDVDGGLIGGASLKSSEFLSLCSIAMGA